MNVSFRNRGFTIVELLIVIVIIAILAAITIVAFSGIQTRAENAKTNTAVTQFAKGLMLFNSQESKYPLQAQSNFWCVGQSSCGAQTNVASNTCIGITPITGSSDLATAMTPYINPLPSPSDSYTDCGTAAPTVKVRGIIYYTNGGNSVTVYWYLKGDQACQSLSGGQSPSKSLLGSTTLCSVVFA